MQSAAEILSQFNPQPGSLSTWRESQSRWEATAERLRIAADLADEYAFYASEIADSEEDDE